MPLVSTVMVKPPARAREIAALALRIRSQKPSRAQTFGGEAAVMRAQSIADGELQAALEISAWFGKRIASIVRSDVEVRQRMATDHSKLSDLVAQGQATAEEIAAARAAMAAIDQAFATAVDAWPPARAIDTSKVMGSVGLYGGMPMYEAVQAALKRPIEWNRTEWRR